MELNKIYNSDCLGGLKTLPDNSIDCCVTSPPYFGLRDYGHEGQIGLEETPEMYVDKIVQVFEEVRRVLKKDGTLWLNLGDSYAGSMKGKNKDGSNGTDSEKQLSNRGTIVGSLANHRPSDPNSSTLQGGKKNQLNALRGHENFQTPNCKPKDLIGIPWTTAFALRSKGWYLRQEIIWAKAYSTLYENFGSVMPESMNDRFVKSHEQLFLISKSRKYYFDLNAIKKDIKESSSKRLSQNISEQNGSGRVPGKTNGNMKAVVGPQMARNGTNVINHSGDIQEGLTANKRSVWYHNPSGFSEAHFATFPEDLIVDCIKAGCREGGIVLDPFMGAGTTALVARKLNRNFIGFELNEEYIKIAEKRLRDELGMFQ